MSWLANFRIRSRLLLLLVFSVFSLVVLGGFSSWMIKREADRSTAFIDVEFASVQALSDVRAAIGNARMYEKDIFLTMGDEKETAHYVGLWKAEWVHIGSAIARAAEVSQPTEVALLADMQKSMDRYSAGFKGILGQLERGELNDPWAANASMAPLKDEIRKADKAFADLSTMVESRAGDRRKMLALTAAEAPWLVIMATGLMSVFATLLALAIVKSILMPIRDLQATAGAWGQGDLTATVDVNGRDEIADAKRDLEKMHRSLSTLVAQVHSGVEMVNSNTSDIARANEELSGRSDRAVRSSEKIAVSIEHLLAAVKHTSDSASQAVDTASSAARVAAQGGAVVARVVTTMDDINASSRKIADIVSVIDSIAFQTNILALNAAVEAARAGDQGRGFAVVATEVRSLAGRSADAAREIKSIIASSVEKVKQGSELVADAGRTMHEIVASVERVSGVIDAIRVAANDQHEGISLISAAMGGIDQATRHNAKMVERSVAGAQGLSQQTQHLRGAVSVFKLAGEYVDFRPLALANYA
jgi:methyl-accepting chemotaxis protein